MPNGQASKQPPNRQSDCRNVKKKKTQHELPIGRFPNPNRVPCVLTTKTKDVLVQENQLDNHLDNKVKEANSAASSLHGKLILYPAYTHPASATYFKWVNLTAHEIHHCLQHHNGYTHSWQSVGYRTYRDEPLLLFYLNHPIQFVQVVGVVVNLEEWFEWFWLFTIDDSSGTTIDVVCRKPDKQKPQQQYGGPDEEDRKTEEQEILKLSEEVSRIVDIGTVLQVKGTVTSFQRRQALENTLKGASKHEAATRQITLARLVVVHDTNQELALIAARNKLHQDVLTKPWQLTKKEQQVRYRKAAGDVEKKRTHAKKLVEKRKQAHEEEHKDEEAIAAEYEMEERLREEEAAKARKAGEDLRLRPLKVHDQYSDRHKRMRSPGSDEVCAKVESASAKTAKPEKRKRMRKLIEAGPKPSDLGGDTTMSFGIDDDERSALLRAAFG